MNTIRSLHKCIIVAIVTVSGLCCPQISNAVLPDVNVITVYYSQELGQIDKKVFGNNFMGYDPNTLRDANLAARVPIMNYGAGIWDPNGQVSVTEVIDLAIATGTSIVRFPGGCGTHWYDWKNAIGPGRTEFLYGIDEFLTTADEIGADVVMTVSYYLGDENDAADLVEYLNAPNDGSNPNGGIDWAAERASNGHPAPYNVKYFEIGNETWSGHPTANPPITGPTALEYATRYLLYYNAMKAVDSSIEIGVVLWWNSSWNNDVIPTVGSNVDFGIMHTYPSPKQGDLTTMDPNDIYRITLGAPNLRDEAHYQNLLTLLRNNAGRDIPLAITEYNGGFAVPKDPPYRHCLGTSLLNAEMIRIFMKPKHQILMGNNWQFSNSYWGMVRTTESLFAYVDHNYPDPIAYTNRPNYYPHEMYNDYFGDVLIDVDVNTTFYEIQDLNDIEYAANIDDLKTYIAAYIEDTNIYYLSVNASKSQDGNEVCLMVINKNMYDSITSTIALIDFVPDGPADAWVLNGPSVNATNEDDPNNVKVVYQNFLINGNSFEFTFEPHSLTAIVFSGTASLPEPVGFWKMDETSWTPVVWDGNAPAPTTTDVNDSSTYDNDGQSIVNSGGAVGIVNDIDRGQVGSFSDGGIGAAGFVSVLSSPSLQISSNITIASWVKVDGTTDDGNNHILSKGSNTEYKLHLGSSGSQDELKLTLWNSSGAMFTYPSGLTFDANEWHHVAAVADFTDSNVYFYVDAGSAAEQTSTVALDPNQSDIKQSTWVLTLGAATSRGHGAFDGWLDEVRLYNVALTDAQIAQIAGNDTNAPAAPTNLVATAGEGQVSLDWDNNTETDLAGYNVYRSQDSNFVDNKLNASLVSDSNYVDSTVTNDITYYYVVTAVDDSNNDSNDSNVVSATPTGSGLVGHWALDEGDGNTVSDDTANNNDGNILGATWTTGRIGPGALSFDGVNNLVSVPSSSSLKITGDLAISAWIYGDVWSGSPRTIVAKGFGWGTEEEGYCLLIDQLDANSPFELAFGLADQNGTVQWYYSSGFDPNTGQWYQVAAVADFANEEIRFYVDEALMTTVPVSQTSIYPSVDPLRIGAKHWDEGFFPSWPWDGVIDDVRIYNTALTVGQIAKIAGVQPDPATNPNPADSATDVFLDATLSWTADAGADSHDVYFGTTSPGDYQGNQPGTTFDPAPLTAGTTYYWRIDEVNDTYGTTTGTVWSFTTAAPLPTAAGFWKMDENGGSTVYDDTANNNDGTISGAGVTWTTGKVGTSALAFDSSGDHVCVNDSTSLNITGDLTISAWVNVNDMTTRGHIVSKSSGNAYKLFFKSTTNGGKLTLMLKENSADNTYSSCFIPNIGQWYHVAAVVDFTAGNVHFYVDGELSSTVSLTQSSIDIYNWYLTLGSNTIEGYGPFNGILDGVRIYNTALTAGQINQIYNCSN